MTLWIQRLTSSFRYSDYRWFWTGSMLTQMALRMQDVVLGWQILEATDSAFWVGVVAFARHLPLLIWSPITGVLADRMKRQWIMVAALMLASISSAGLALLTALGRVASWHIIVTSFLWGSAFTLYSPAGSALLPNLVPVRMLLSAATIQYSSGRLMGFFGPPVAGLLVDVIGVPLTLMVEVVLCVLAGLMFVRTGVEVDCPLQSHNRGGSMVGGFREATAYLRHDQPLLTLVLLGLVMIPVGMSYHQLMPVFVRDSLGTGASTLGLMLGVYYLGLALSGFAMAAVGDTFRKGRAVLLSSTVFGCALMVFAFSKQVVLALVLLLVLGLLAGVYLTLNTVLFQSRPPDILRGRMMSVWSMVWGLSPFANLAAGAVAERWGVATVLAASGAICAVFCTGMALVGSHLKEV